MNDAFAPQILAADIGTVHDIFRDFFAELSAADWQRPTETGGWTLQETVVHLDAVALGYQQTIDAILANQTFDFDGMTRREELPLWNEMQIELRRQRPIADVCASFLATLQTAATSATQRQTAELGRSHSFPFYNNPITLAELYGAQATHPGLVHAAQVAHGAQVHPLWRLYPPDLLQRQITRLLHLMALSYWTGRAGNLQAIVNFVVPQQASWHLHLSPQGCEVKQGKGKRPSLTIWFRNLDSLCRSLTLQISPLRATFTGRAFAWGKLPLVFRLEHLFNPTSGL
jgi:hypothetical protein